MHTNFVTQVKCSTFQLIRGLSIYYHKRHGQMNEGQSSFYSIMNEVEASTHTWMIIPPISTGISLQHLKMTWKTDRWQDSHEEYNEVAGLP